LKGLNYELKTLKLLKLDLIRVGKTNDRGIDLLFYTRTWLGHDSWLKCNYN
jgi:hypothetical protein